MPDQDFPQPDQFQDRHKRHDDLDLAFGLGKKLGQHDRFFFQEQMQDLMDLLIDRKFFFIDLINSFFFEFAQGLGKGIDQIKQIGLKINLFGILFDFFG